MAEGREGERRAEEAKVCVGEAEKTKERRERRSGRKRSAQRGRGSEREKEKADTMLRRGRKKQEKLNRN